MNDGMNKLVIGTAQFGQNYGITNANGKVPQNEVQTILNLARSHGVKTLDTAGSYGESEKILGVIGVDDFDVITKLPSFEPVLGNLENFCEASLKYSLSNLQVSSVDTVLLHRPEELLGVKGKFIFKSLANLKDKGLVKRIGISIYSPDILDGIISKYAIDVVQAPFNVFDRRIVRSGWLKKLTEKNIKIIARSVFLQGILLADPIDLPIYFHRWRVHFEKWANFLQENSLSALEASLQFVAQVPEVEKLIVGVESGRQFSEIVEALDNVNMVESRQLEITDVGLISPVDWSM